MLPAKMALSFASASHGNASWLLQPDLSSPWGKLWMLSSGQVWCLLVVEHILTEFMVVIPALVATLPSAATVCSLLELWTVTPFQGGFS